MVEYVKTENRILRQKLPRRIDVTAAERAKLVRLGARLGSAIKDVITIVHPRTFAKKPTRQSHGTDVMTPQSRGFISKFSSDSATSFHLSAIIRR